MYVYTQNFATLISEIVLNSLSCNYQQIIAKSYVNCECMCQQRWELRKSWSVDLQG